MDSKQKVSVNTGIKTKLDETEHSQIAEREKKSLRKIVADHKNVFHTSFPAG